MAIQFHCPHGHLLQADEAHMGMQTQCPYCSVMLLIPVVESQALQTPPTDQRWPQGSPPSSSEQALAAVETDQRATAKTQVEREGPTVAEVGSDESTLLHIPCPNGHELETPYEMLGQEVLCPQCRVRFWLRVEDSREHQVRMEERFERRARFWFNWSIAAAVIVGGGLLLLVSLALSK
jgi:hypothetical protein